MCIDSPRLQRQRKGPAIGYRVFDVRNNRVQSLYWNAHEEWTHATRATENDPRRDADFGFHAFKTLHDAQRRYRSVSLDRIYAKVRGSGIVVRHRTGFRSSRMKILKFYVPQTFRIYEEATVRVLKRYYRVPVVYLP